MRILLIKPKHIGDSLILTPTITAIKAAYPEGEIWVIVRRGCEGILAGHPDIARLLTLTGVGDKERRPGDFWRQVQVLLQLWSVTFDYVFELGDGHRARLFAMLTRAKRRYSVKTASPLTWLESQRFTAVSIFDSQWCHRVEKDFRTVGEFLPLREPIPALRFDREFAREWASAAALTDFCVMQIGKRQLVSRWNRQGWLEVGHRLLERCGSVVIASGPAPDEVEEAAWLAAQLGPRAFCTRGGADWPQMAGLLYRARLYVGLDTAAMHLAAACGCPIVALFGPSLEDHWHPWHAPYRIVTSRDYVPVDDPAERHKLARKRTMDEIKVEDVIAACDELLAQATR
jgi:heptosyltransferase III